MPTNQRLLISAMAAVGALLVALAVVGALVPRPPTGGPAAALPSATVIVGVPGGSIRSSVTPTAPERTTPAPTPRATSTPTPAPTMSPVPTAAPVSAPTAAATPQPAPEPTSVIVAVAGADDAVAAFYRSVAAGNFDAAYAMWSERMKATYPRQENLDGRFDDTASITFHALFVAQQGESSATVQANFTETYDSGASRDFIGYWELIRVGERWLLDAPHY